jgi:hypothetical protein
MRVIVLIFREIVRLEGKKGLLLTKSFRRVPSYIVSRVTVTVCCVTQRDPLIMTTKNNEFRNSNHFLYFLPRANLDLAEFL